MKNGLHVSIGGAADLSFDDAFRPAKDHYNHHKIDCGHYKWLSNLNGGRNKILVSLPTNTFPSIHSDETCSVAPTTYGEKVYLCHPSEDVPKKSMGDNKEPSTSFGVNYADSHDNSLATLPDKTEYPPYKHPKQ